MFYITVFILVSDLINKMQWILVNQLQIEFFHPEAQSFLNFLISCFAMDKN